VSTTNEIRHVDILLDLFQQARDRAPNRFERGAAAPGGHEAALDAMATEIVAHANLLTKHRTIPGELVTASIQSMHEALAVYAFHLDATGKLDIAGPDYEQEPAE
jgi:hypothetical protein